jgi:hypothetical protein
MNPHRLWLHTLIKVLESVVKTTLAEPYCLRHPLLNLLKVNLEYFRGKIGDEGFRNFSVILTASLCECCRVAISVFMSKSALQFTLDGNDAHLTKSLLRLAYAHFLAFHQ